MATKTSKNPIMLDPQRMGMLRGQFIADMGRRFTWLRGEVITLVEKEDAFGLSKHLNLKGRLVGNAILVENTRWQFATDDRKLMEFQNWFEGQVQAGVLSTDPATGAPWTATYVHSAYRQGMLRAYTDSKKLELAKTPGFYNASQEQFLKDSFNHPEAVSKLRLLSTRSFEQLKGVTAEMSRDMNRILAEGISNGKGARDIARSLAKNVDGMSKMRALRVARTELSVAHNEGQLDAFERMGIDELGIMAEWQTTSNPCPLCQPMTGTVLTVKQARGMLPRHPNCKCAWIPASVESISPGQKVTKKAIDAAIKKSAKAEKPNSKNPLKDSNWKGADVKTSARDRKALEKKMRDAERQQEQVALAPMPQLFNKQPTEVIRWMGKNGWTAKEASMVLKNLGVDVAEATVKTQLAAGKKGQRGAPADLTLEQIDYFETKRRSGATEVLPPPPITPPKVVTPPPPPKPLPPPDSEWKETVYIVRDKGRDLVVTPGSDNFFGDGIYVTVADSADNVATKFYLDVYKREGRDVEVVEATLDIRKMITFDLDKLGYNESDQLWGVKLDDLMKYAPDEAKEPYFAKLKELANSRGGYLSVSGIERIRMAENTLKEVGYDSVRIKQNKFTAKIGGDQIVVFDGKHVKVTPPKIAPTKPIVLPPPIVPPVTPPPPVVPPPPPTLPVTPPPTVTPPTVAPEFKQVPTAIVRWMGKEGFDFKQAKAALQNAGITVADATIKAQLAAGKKGLRGDPADLTPEQVSFLKSTSTVPILRPDPPKVVPKPPPAIIRPAVNPVIPSTPKVSPKKAAEDKQADKEIPPAHLGFTGKQQTEFAKKVWAKMDGKRPRSLDEFLDIGKLVVEETMNDPVFGAAKRNYDQAKADVDRALQVLFKGKKESDIGYMDISLIERSGNSEKKQLLALFRKQKTVMYSSAQIMRTESNRVSLAALRQIRDMGGIPLKVQKQKEGTIKKDVENAIHAVEECFPKTWLREMKSRLLEPDHGDRGIHSRRGKKTVIRLTGTAKTMRGIAVHEVMHHAEAEVRFFTEDVGRPEKLGKYEREFLTRRTKGEKLSQIYPGRKGLEHEVGVKDEFSEHYMGKDYKHFLDDHFEVLTMGVQGVFGGDYDVTTDTEYYSFVLGLLAGM